VFELVIFMIAGSSVAPCIWQHPPPLKDSLMTTNIFIIINLVTERQITQSSKLYTARSIRGLMC